MPQLGYFLGSYVITKLILNCSPTGWNVLATEAKLQSIQYPMFEEPSPSVEFTFSFKRDLFYDPVSGTLMKANQTTLLPQRGDQNEF